MKLTRKYPLFIVSMVVLTGAAIAISLTVVSTRALEKEISKRGLSLARNFSVAHAPLLLSGDKSKLQLAANTLLSDTDVIDLKVVNHKGVVVSSKDQEDVGQPYVDFRISLEPPPKDVEMLPKSVTDTPDLPPAERVFGFVAPMAYGNVHLGVLILTLSRRSIEQSRERAVMLAMMIGLGVAFLLSVGAVLATRRELRIVQEMQRALTQQAQGQFGSRIKAVRKDELGDLARSFNAMSDQIELFFHYVDRSIVDRLVQDPTLAKPGGQLKEVSVLYGDMRGYTAMSNRRTAQEVVRIINAYFYLFIEIVSNFKGVVDKTMGDAVMSVFERTKEDLGEDYKRRAVLSAAYMKAATVVLNRFIELRVSRGDDLHFEPCAFGFAMAAGTAIVGNMGSRHRMDYTVCGRVVNLASRLEKETPRGEVVIDNFSRMASDDLVIFETLPAVQPKGFSAAEKVTPHRVIGIIESQVGTLRNTLKHVFSEEFFSDHIVPEDLEGEVKSAWIHDARMAVMEIIAQVPTHEFFEPTPAKPH